MKGNHKYLKRFLTFVLTLAMIITYMPTWMFAYAVDGQEEPAAVEEVVEGPAAEVTEETATEEAVEEAATQKAEEPDAVQAPDPAPAKENADEAPQGDTLTYIDEKYEIIVTVGDEAGINADDYELSFTEYDKSDQEYEDAKKALLADEEGNSPFSEFDVDASDDELKNLGLVAFDLSLKNKKTGEVKEPEGAVAVSVKLKELPEGSDADALASSMEIQHLNESSGDVVVEKVATVDATAAKKDDSVGEITVDKKKETAEVEFAVESFSTYTITYYYGYRNKSVIYEDESGNSLTPDMTPNFDARYQFLIYDIPGYEYSYTAIGTRTGTRIKPLLRAESNSGLYYSDEIEYQRANENQWRDVGNNAIHVVYKRKTAPTEGGTPSSASFQPSDWPSSHPELSKDSVNNGDGTNTIRLSIKAPEKTVESGTKANVIVVFDISGSMLSNMDGQYNAGNNSRWDPESERRLTYAKAAVNTMADTLLSKNGVKMGLVSFSTTGQTVVDLSDPEASSKDLYKAAVNNLSAGGGTNWEQALIIANRMAVESDAATFVVFVTDGDPTFRKSRGQVTDSNLDVYDSNTTYTYYRNDLVFGEGNDDSQGRNYDAALSEVVSIVDSNKQFYAIGVSNDVEKVEDLCTDANVSKDHAFKATSTTELEEAFDAITSDIETKLGFGNIAINDGVTSMTNVEAKINADPSSFQYYRYGGDGNKYGNGYANRQAWDPTADGCALATYDSETGSIKWNMGDQFQLENGVTYVVEAIAWPTQAAYDLVADLNNNLRTYDELSTEEKSQVRWDDVSKKYVLKTNRDNSVNATYTQTSKTGDQVTTTTTTGPAGYTEGTIQNLVLEDETITVKKIWNNLLDSREDDYDSIRLNVDRDGQPYLHDTEDSEHAVEVSAAKDWLSDPVDISIGQIRKNTADNTYKVLEQGHDFTISERADDAYYWDLDARDYRPMNINGTTTILILDDEAEGVDGVDYYILAEPDDGDPETPAVTHKYKVAAPGDDVLTAVNNRRSHLNLSKTINAAEGVTVPEHALFGYQITIGKTGDPDIYFSAWSGTGTGVDGSGYNVITGNGITKEIKTDEPKPGEWRDEDGWTGYYTAPAGTPFTINIEEGWNIRFLNIPKGTEYSIEEITQAEGSAFDSAAASAETYQYNADTDKWDTIPVEYNPTISDEKVTGTIPDVNTSYSIGYTNKYEETTKQITKTWVLGDDATVPSVTPEQFKEWVKLAQGDEDVTEKYKDLLNVSYESENNKLTYIVKYEYLPKYVDGAEVSYSITEDAAKAAAAGFVVTTDANGNITNTKEKGSLTVKKNLASTSEITDMSKLPNISFTITGPDGYNETVQLNDFDKSNTSEYSLTINNLGVGTYTVTENEQSAAITGYELEEVKYTPQDGKAAVTAQTPGEVTVTNSYKQTLTSKSVEKVWGDPADLLTYGIISVTVTLKNITENAIAGTYDLIADEGWKHTFEGIPMYTAQGIPIVYEIVETAVNGRNDADLTEAFTNTPEVTGDTTKITNTSKKTTAEATKEWVNADGTKTPPANAKVTFTLYADDEVTDYTVELDGTPDETVPTATAGYESAEWKATFVNLPEYNDKGNKVVYTVKETTGYPGYTASPADAVESGGKITNSQDTTELEVDKKWVNADGSTTWPTGVTVTLQLTADGTPVAGKTVTLTADKKSDKFTSLPKYAADGETPINYSVAEAVVTGYSSAVVKNEDGTVTVTNTQGKTSADATKAWKNADGSTEAPEGATVEFTLYADGTATNYKVTLNGTVDETPTGTAGYESEKWKASFINLPEKNSTTGEPIAYTVAETTGYPGYTMSGSPAQSGGTITNSQETTTANATKAWKNADGSTTPPANAKVTFTLYADETETDYTVELDGTPDENGEATAWVATFTDLPKYKIGEDGEAVAIVYTVAETGTYPGYTPSTTEPVESGKSITNTEVVTTANATKAWKNANGSTTAPTGASVVYTLYEDGKETTKTITLDGVVDENGEAAAWVATFTNLPKYKIVEGEAVEIEYTVAETTTFPGYTPSITDPVASGETITNSQEPTTAEATKVWANADGTATAPEDATVTFTLYADGTATDYTVTLDGAADETVPTGTGGYEVSGRPHV